MKTDDPLSMARPPGLNLIILFPLILCVAVACISKPVKEPPVQPEPVVQPLPAVVEVEAFGYGVNEPDAIRDAQIKAVRDTLGEVAKRTSVVLDGQLVYESARNYVEGRVRTIECDDATTNGFAVYIGCRFEVFRSELQKYAENVLLVSNRKRPVGLHFVRQSINATDLPEKLDLSPVSGVIKKAATSEFREMGFVMENLSPLSVSGASDPEVFDDKTVALDTATEIARKEQVDEGEIDFVVFATSDVNVSRAESEGDNPKGRRMYDLEIILRMRVVSVQEREVLADRPIRLRRTVDETGLRSVADLAREAITAMITKRADDESLMGQIIQNWNPPEPDPSELGLVSAAEVSKQFDLVLRDENGGSLTYADRAAIQDVLVRGLPPRSVYVSEAEQGEAALTVYFPSKAELEEARAELKREIEAILARSPTAYYSVEFPQPAEGRLIDKQRIDVNVQVRDQTLSGIAIHFEVDGAPGRGMDDLTAHKIVSAKARIRGMEGVESARDGSYLGLTAQFDNPGMVLDYSGRIEGLAQALEADPVLRDQYDLRVEHAGNFGGKSMILVRISVRERVPQTWSEIVNGELRHGCILDACVAPRPPVAVQDDPLRLRPMRPR